MIARYKERTAPSTRPRAASERQHDKANDNRAHTQAPQFRTLRAFSIWALQCGYASPESVARFIVRQIREADS